MPALLQAALAEHPDVAECFARMSPSCRRESLDWIAGAKREETRTRRVARALATIAKGKRMNWQYELTSR